jgi:Secretion system C-terminal sorting domain
MYKKIFLSAFILLLTSKIFAQQIPVGMCGIVYIYDANGARVKRTYFCNNGTDPYPTARATNLLKTDSSQNTIEDKGLTIMFEKIDAIFPNPTSGKFAITFSSALVNAKIIITDAQGKTVFQTVGNGNKIDFDISKFTTGVYFVSINENGKIITQKIMKQ